MGRVGRLLPAPAFLAFDEPGKLGGRFRLGRCMRSVCGQATPTMDDHAS
jgi:hypothetical protein